MLTFTAINPDDVTQEERIAIEITEDKTFVINGTPIDAQQLAELGMLLFSLASQSGIDDLDSCVELLDGFEIPVPVKDLKEIITL